LIAGGDAANRAKILINLAFGAADKQEVDIDLT
jgi:hypothetical protein